MKTVEYKCDVCFGRLIDPLTLTWTEMVFGLKRVYRWNFMGKSSLDLCNSCWHECQNWVKEKKCAKP